MRRFLQLFALLLVLLVAAVFTSPYWLGAVLPIVGRRFGATVETYSRIGYNRFALENVTVRRNTVTVHVARVEADTPWLWSWTHLRRSDRAIVAGAWTVDVVRSDRPRPQHEASGWIQLQSELLHIAAELERWLPRATIGPGKVNWPGGGLSLASAVWSDRALDVKGLAWVNGAANVRAQFTRENGIHVTGEMTSAPVAVELLSQGATARGTATVLKQPAQLEATFDSAGWIPVSGKITAENWRLPAEELHLSGYADIEGGAHATWDHDQFDLSSDIRGHSTEKKGAPDLHVRAHAKGNRDSYVIEQCDVTAPGIQAKLSEPVHGGFGENIAGPPSQFTFTADLSQLPWFTARGKIDGEVHIEPRAGGIPRFTFTGRGANVAIDQWNLTGARIEGQLDWPRLTLTTADFASSGEARLTVTGGCDFRAKALIDARAEGRLSPALIQPWLPKTITFSRADVVLKASGPWLSPTHEGAVNVSGIVIPRMAKADARVWWKGSGAKIDQGEFGIQAGATEVVAAGSVQRDQARLEKLVWKHAQQDRLALERPSVIRWSPKVQVDALDLSGPAGELRFSGNWGDAGELKFFARGIEGEWWRDFVPSTPFRWSVDTLSAKASWNGGPATVDTSGKLFLDLEGRDRIAFDLAAHSDGKSVVVDRLRALEQEREFATFHGEIPAVVTLGPKPSVELGRTEKIAIEGHVDPQARWWAELGDRTGVRLDGPNLTLKLGGTWEQPTGSASLDVVGVTLDERFGARKWPKIERVHVLLQADGSTLKLQPAQAIIEGQPLELTAAMPTNAATWAKLRQDPVAVLRDEVEISIRAKDTDVAAFTPYAAGFLLPQGRLDADLTLSVHGDWKGYLRLRDLGTRPLGSFGPLRDIQADLALDGRELKVNSIQVGVGGQTVTAKGQAEFPVGKEPSFELTASGQNLPFVRQAGFLIRGDVNMKVASGRGRLAPLVSGNVELHDGLFLSDVRALVPHGGGASPERRPPYFSVDTEPFKTWRLNLNVRGEHFLRARTTLFNGEASTQFRLEGTLGDPRAVGEVRINDGQVLFPFATFQLQDATVRLTEENPYDPQLAIFGTSTRYGYDLRLELSGAASTPQLVFTSNPPLTSEQVLLLVMAGQTPKNEVNYTASQRFARLGTYFGQSLLNSLGGGGGGSDRLTISSGERISQEGRETYDVEYKLGNRWAIVGEYDEYDEYNAGLKYRVLPKQLRRDER